MRAGDGVHLANGQRPLFQGRVDRRRDYPHARKGRRNCVNTASLCYQEAEEDDAAGGSGVISFRLFGVGDNAQPTDPPERRDLARSEWP